MDLQQINSEYGELLSFIIQIGGVSGVIYGVFKYFLKPLYSIIKPKIEIIYMKNIPHSYDFEVWNKSKRPVIIKRINIEDGKEVNEFFKPITIKCDNMYQLIPKEEFNSFPSKGVVELDRFIFKKVNVKIQSDKRYK